MPEYSGSLQSFEVAAFLWLAPLVPLVGAVYALLAGRPLARGPSEERRLPDPLVVARGTSLLAPTPALLALAVRVAAGRPLGVARVKLTDPEQRRRLAVSASLG